MWPKPDPKAETPVSEQIRRSVVARIASGALAEGDRLPSVRALAAEILVNPNTVAKSYGDLERDGFVLARPGSGVTVAPRARALAERRMRADLLAKLAALIEEARGSGIAEGAIEELFVRARTVAQAGRNR